MAKSYKKIRRPERRRLVALLVMVLLAFSAWILFSPYGAIRYYRVSRDLRAVKSETQRIDAENKDLAAEIHQLKTDRSYQESVARSTFGMVKKNEIVFDFSGEKSEKKKEKEEGKRQAP